MSLPCRGLEVDTMRKAQSRRAFRLEESIKQELSRILLEEIQDPRLELVTISGVRLNSDLSVAEVLYTHSASLDKHDQVQAGLKAAHGYLRTLLGKKIKMRYVPELRFKWDEFLETMIHDTSQPDT